MASHFSLIEGKGPGNSSWKDVTVKLNQVVSQEAMQQLLSQQSALVFVLNYSTRKIEFVNQEKFLGHRLEYWGKSENFRKKLHPSCQGPFKNFWKQLLTNGESKHSFKVKNRKMRWKWISVRAKTLRWNVNNFPEAFLFTVIKNEDLHVFEDKLSERIAYYNAVLNAGETGIFAIDNQYRILLVNDCHQKYSQRIFGQQYRIGTSAFRYIPTGLRLAEYKKLLDAALKGDEIQSVFKLKKQDGHHYWAEFDVSPIYQQKIIIGALVHAQDVTGKIENEQKIKAAHTNLKTIINNTEDAIWSIDRQFRVIIANETFSKLFEKYFQRPVHPGDRIIDIISDSIKDLWLDRYAMALDGKKFEVKENYTLQGRVYYFLTNFNPIIDEKGNVLGCCMYSKDITEIHTAQEALKEHNQQLLQANEQLDRFVYSVSHDLRAPIASSLGLIELANLSTEMDELRELLELQKKNLQKMDNFISDIVEYARNARQELKIQEISFEQTIQQLLEQLSHMQGVKQIDKKIEIHQHGPFFSDQNRLNIIISNLLSNAFKYFNPYEEAPFVKVKVFTSPQHAKLEISDNGIGISEKHLNKIFDMFYRASNACSGTGIGLYILKEALQKLNGTIQVESEVGFGTTFEVQIPNHHHRLHTEHDSLIRGR
ncbi:PAS domain-containing sensor histidine kinase [Rapidithrix thailandica]|uniref:histidine kinase n=1 Tax=Rapidithrix thailandica TaxID=413964 RepID=A0AAW9RRS5_9BACT